MSDSVAVVVLDRVKDSVRNNVRVSESRALRLSSKKKISIEAARERILTKTVERALMHAKNDEKVATTALVITNGRVNRLPQCTSLLFKYEDRTVRVAYAIKEELAFASTPLRALCKLVEYTDEDMEGEAARLRDLLEEVAMQSKSQEQQWYFTHLIETRLSEGHLLESIEDEILERIERPFAVPTHSGVA